MRKKSSKAGLKPSKRPVQTEVQANQWQSNPKQKLWIDLYMNPKNRETFGNAYKAALKAGYTEAYARTILNQGTAWIREARSLRGLEPEHIIQGIQEIAVEGGQDRDKLKALELLAKMKGMMVDRSITAHVNIEQALGELK